MTYSSNIENTMQQNESPTRTNQCGATDSVSQGSPLHRLHITQNLPFFKDFKEYLCGWGAAFINITVTYPIYKIIFRQMLHGVGIRSAFQQLSNEGIYFLYRGILPPLCQKTLSLSLMFGLYEECRRPLEEARFSAVASKSIAAMIAGEPVKCGDVIRLTHLATLKNLHSHHFASPLSGDQEISAYGDDNGVGDSGDHWMVLCEGEFWERDEAIMLKHIDTEVYLSATGRTYGRPINGQAEIVGVPTPAVGHVHWKAMEGLFIHPSDFNPKSQHIHSHHTEL